MKKAKKLAALLLSLALVSPTLAAAAPEDFQGEEEQAATSVITETAETTETTEDLISEEDLSQIAAEEEPQDVGTEVPSEEETTEPPAVTEPDSQTVTVTFMDGAEILLTQTLPVGEAPQAAPKTASDGSLILAWVANGKKIADPTRVSLWQDTVYTVWKVPVLNTETHDSYINGKGEATFSPNNNLTRAEAATIVSSLLKDKHLGVCTASFSDVSAGDWYYQSVTLLSSLGILNGYEDGTFRPNQTITRAEFVTILSSFFAPVEGTARFQDVPATHWALKNISSANARGWINGYDDGTFRPDKTITRAEAVTVMNAVLGRSASHTQTMALIQNGGVSVFRDVRPSDWFYAAVMEASTNHSYSKEYGQEIWTDFVYRSCGYNTGLQLIGSAYYLVDENQQLVFLPAGIQTLDGKSYYVAADGSIPAYSAGPHEIGNALYYINADNTVALNQTVGYLYFGADGKYTTKNPELDALVEKTIAGCTQPNMTQAEKLRACYLYLRENCRYLARDHHGRGTTYWTEESAIWMFTYQRGNCYCYAAAFQYMANRLGYQAYSISGGLGTSNSDHAWVMIDGKLYDPELEYAYLYRFSTSRYYNLYGIYALTAPFVYVFPA